MRRNRVRLIPAALLILFMAACGGGQAGEAEDEAMVAIVTVNESDQYVEIRNNEETVQELNGWYLSLGRRLTCHLDEEIRIQPGETLRIWALAEDAGRGGFNCGLGRPFWSSKEPKRVFLYNGEQDVMDGFFGEGG